MTLRPIGRHDMICCCNGILNQVTGIRYCQGTMVSPRLNSFFTHCSLNPSTVLEIVFSWLCRVRRTQVAEPVGVSRKTIRLVLNDWFQMLQEDLKEEDTQISMSMILVLFLVAYFVH